MLAPADSWLAVSDFTCLQYPATVSYVFYKSISETQLMSMVTSHAIYYMTSIVPLFYTDYTMRRGHAKFLLFWRSKGNQKTTFSEMVYKPLLEATRKSSG